MSFLEVASRNDGVTQRSVDFPFFMAVMYRGKMIDKKIFSSKFDFADGEKRKAIVESFKTTLFFNRESLSTKDQETAAQTAPGGSECEARGSITQLADYEVLIGFQLSKDELEYNVFQ